MNQRAIVARHEAAHSVAAARLGLPLVSVEIRTRHEEREGRTWRFLGGADLEDGVVRRWLDALPDPAARLALTNRATMVAAGPVAEQLAGYPPDHMGARGDWQILFHTAFGLGIGRSSEDAAVQAWANERTREATNLLLCDDRLAWDRVRVALERKGKLTGAEVRALVGGPS